ncbi:I17RC protein, partial [Herpetotheres cachinnans]|nr:I17RC protein [Herpetotheres cachinnans]
TAWGDTPFPGAAADTEAWERLWARSRLVLHAMGQVLTCSLLAPCDLPAKLVPCWQPVPAKPCQALPGLQQPAVGQGPQEFGGLRPHPNLCVQVWSGGQVRLTQCLRDREYCWGGRAGAARGSGWGESPPWPPLAAPQPPDTSPGVLPGHPDDLLLLECGGNASLCVLEQGTCTPLASFTSTVRGREPIIPVAVAPVAQPAHPLPPLQGVGHPGLLEQELRRDVAAGQCRQVSAGSQRAAGKDQAACDMYPCPQIWHPENSTGVTLWACPLHKYLRARWALAWMGVLLGAACLLLLLLLKKEDVKGERSPPGGCAQRGT